MELKLKTPNFAQLYQLHCTAAAQKTKQQAPQTTGFDASQARFLRQNLRQNLMTHTALLLLRSYALHNKTTCSALCLRVLSLLKLNDA